MDLNKFTRILRRWIVAIGVISFVVVGLAGWRVATADTLYEASVKLQLTAPQSEDVVIFNTNRTVTNVREEMTVARNNFGEILQSREIYERTVRQLGLTGREADYKLDLRPLRDSDFLVVAVQSENPQLVGQIVNVHVNSAINYYGEVRAKPATAAKSFLADQVTTADKRVRTAESALADFQMQNRVTNVSNDMTTAQKVIEQLYIERNRRKLEGPSSRALDSAQTVQTQLRIDRELAGADGNLEKVARYDQAILAYTQVISSLLQSGDSVAQVDELIGEYQTEVMRLAGLQPRYNTLQEELDQARNEYQQLVAKYTEATLKEQTVQAASFIQIIEPGIAPIEPVSTRPVVILVLALFASLILGVVAAFVLDYIFPATLEERRVFNDPTPVDVKHKLRKTASR